MIQFRAFTKNDWMGFAGAEPFRSVGCDKDVGDLEPLIAELIIDGSAAVAVLDVHGIEVYAPELLADLSWRCADDLVSRAVALLQPSMSIAELEALGFVSLAQ